LVQEVFLASTPKAREIITRIDKWDCTSSAQPRSHQQSDKAAYRMGEMFATNFIKQNKELKK
jgi:hypothetical protein